MSSGSRPTFIFFTLCFVAAVAQLAAFVHAQSTGTNANSTASLTTSSFTTTFTTVSGGRTLTSSTVLPTTLTLSPTPSATSTNSTGANSTASASASATPISLDTRIDPGYGVLGALLIITGLPSTFWGHKNRWSSFFLIGFYTFALACLALILKFGVLEAVNPPNEKLRGVFVLACTVAGFAGGAVAIFFWQQAKYFIGAWGGFAVGIWVQCFRDGGLIRPIGFRWLMYIGLGVVGFCLCTVPKLHYHILLVSTAAVGATAFILGVDCFTTANLKEFYVWNLGFDSLFTKYQNAGIHFPISQMMEIELGLIGAFTLMGAAVQFRILKVLQIKLKEIGLEQRRRDEELEAQATARFTGTMKEMADWEKEHGRKESQLSSLPLMRYQELNSPGTDESPTLVTGERRSRYQSGVSEFMAAPPPIDDKRQNMGALPAMDLGLDLESDLPKDFVADEQDVGVDSSKPLTAQELEDRRKKEELMAEIHSIRKSIDQLRSTTPGSSASGEGARSRQQSFTSRRTLSLGFAEALEGPSRPPRSQDPRTRFHSMDRLSQGPEALLAGSAISRSSSVPLQDEPDWNEYVRERKLFQPPAGTSAPIPTTPLAPQPRRPSIAVPNSVSEALMRRHQQEMALEAGDLGILDRRGGSSPSDEQPLGKTRNVQKFATVGSRAPVAILPPRKPDPAMQQQPRPSAPRTRTFEELNERHREKMRDLQAPLSRAEREQAELAAARSRWERSKEVERQVMSKKQAEKMAAAKQAEKQRQPGDAKDSTSPGSKQPGEHGEHQRSLSADKLGKLPGAASSTSKRQSMLKVEDWRRYQQEVGTAPAATASKRDSIVPFPVAQSGREPGHHSSSERRKSSQLSPGTNYF